MKNTRTSKALSSLLAICMLFSMFAALSVSAEGTLTLKADSLLSLGDYEGTKTVLGFAEQKTVSDLLANFEISETIVATKDGAELAGDAVVGTGTLITLDADSAYVVVSGDTNGDGIVNATDYLQIKSFFLNLFTLEGINYLAADTDNDSTISSTDYLQIKSYFLGAYELYPEVQPDDTTSDDTTSDDTTSDDTTSDDTTSDDTTSDDTTSDDTTSDDTTSDDTTSDDTTSEDTTSEDTTSEDTTSDDTTSDDTTSDDTTSEVEITYVDDIADATYTLNIKSKKIHTTTCSGGLSTSEKNKRYTSNSLEELLAAGYAICGTCDAGVTEETTSETTTEETTSETTTEETTSEATTEETTSEATTEETTSETTTEETTSEDEEHPYDVVTAPEVDTAYKFALSQASLGQTLYFTGTMSGYYLATTSDYTEGVDVYLETAEGGYYLYFMTDTVKTYINIVERTDAAGKVTINLSEAPSNVYTWDETMGILITNVAGSDWYLGTYSTYTTMSPSNTSYITGDNASKVGVSQFPAYLVTVK